MAANDDPHDLERFVAAQNQHGAYRDAVAELRRGRKRTHWMWFVFPQLRGLGSSWMAERFAIASLEEAHAYLAHPVLGARLRECTGILAGSALANADAIFGAVDAMKLRSSLTLFQQADPAEPLFQSVLDRFFGGAPDERTLERLRPGATEAPEAPR